MSCPSLPFKHEKWLCFLDRNRQTKHISNRRAAVPADFTRNVLEKSPAFDFIKNKRFGLRNSAQRQGTI